MFGLALLVWGGLAGMTLQASAAAATTAIDQCNGIQNVGGQGGCPEFRGTSVAAR